MLKHSLVGFLLLISIFISACAGKQLRITTVEVTRIVPQQQIVTAEVTRVVREPQIVTAEVTRVVREPQIVTVEVTRVSRETVFVTPAPSPVPFIEIFEGQYLQKSRFSHTTTRMLDDRILVTGGSWSVDNFLADVEVYDPVTGMISLAASMYTPRHDHSATLLRDGRVLVVGGYNLPQQWLGDAEVFDPFTNTWIVIPPLYSHGTHHTATLMKDGRVLVAGGAVGSGVVTDRVEIFDPQTYSWIEAAPLDSERYGHTAQLLEDGRVLVAGGSTARGTAPAGGDALFYDPSLDRWTPAASMLNPRVFAESVRLADGRILITGGFPIGDFMATRPLTAADIYYPDLNLWAAAPDLDHERYFHNLILLPTGQVLAIGGARDWDSSWNDSSFVSEIEIFDPAAYRWQVIASLPLPATQSSAVLLHNGSVWITGGRTNQNFYANTWLMRVNKLVMPVKL